MAESALHIEIVRQMYNWVRDGIFSGDDGSIFVSLPEASVHTKPPNLLFGYQPDLYAIDHKNNLLVVGEAKTIRDIDRPHSIEQYKSYLNTCLQHDGPSYLVFAVPIFWKARMVAIVNRYVKPESVGKIKIEILEFCLG